MTEIFIFCFLTDTTPSLTSSLVQNTPPNGSTRASLAKPSLLCFIVLAALNMAQGLLRPLNSPLPFFFSCDEGYLLAPLPQDVH